MLYHVLGTFFTFWLFWLFLFWGGYPPPIVEPGYMLCIFLLKPPDRISLPFLAHVRFPFWWGRGPGRGGQACAACAAVYTVAFRLRWSSLKSFRAGEQRSPSATWHSLPGGGRCWGAEAASSECRPATAPRKLVCPKPLRSPLPAHACFDPWRFVLSFSIGVRHPSAK